MYFIMLTLNNTYSNLKTVLALDLDRKGCVTILPPHITIQVCGPAYRDFDFLSHIVTVLVHTHSPLSSPPLLLKTKP